MAKLPEITKLSLEAYRSKVLGCWMGKNIGGTLGAPFEWFRQVNNVDFYTQDLGGEPLPNDDLDIQLLWLIMLEEQGLNVNSSIMAEYWQAFVTPHWSEYGNAKINMRAGVLPPYSGMRNNYFKDSCGAFIRSEIWACIAPGNPLVAAQYAYEDAVLDHGDGEGVYAEVFCAALESAAFVESDVSKLIDIGLSYIPENSGVAKAIHCAREAYKGGATWLEARNEVLEGFRGGVFFGLPDRIAPEDIERGFADGQPGWDVPSNMGMLIIGLLYGENDFGKSMCTTVNCGEDTDCTAATIGSIFGIINGIECIPEKWICPIGRKIKTACLNLGELGYFGDMIPTNIDNLTHRTEAIMRKMAVKHDLPVSIPGLPDKPICCLFANKEAIAYMNIPAVRQSFPLFETALEYVSGVGVKPGKAAKIRLTVKNKYRVQAGLTICWYTPEGWEISPRRELKTYVGPNNWQNHSVTHEFDLYPSEGVSASSNRFVIEITVDGRTTVMLVPVLLLLEG